MNYIFIDDYNNKTYVTNDINDYYKYYVLTTVKYCDYIRHSMKSYINDIDELEDYIINMDNFLDFISKNKWEDSYNLYHKMIELGYDLENLSDSIYLVEKQEIKFPPMPSKDIFNKFNKLTKMVIFK